MEGSKVRIKFLRLRRADRNSLTYEYVKPSSALKVAQLRKNQWARALLLGGPLQREELRNPALLDWIRLNSKALRRQLDLLESNERDGEYGLVVVLTRVTSVAFTDIKFLNQGDNLAPIIMGSAVGQNGATKWLRGYPVENARTAFNGEFICNEAPAVFQLRRRGLIPDSRWVCYLFGWIFHPKGFRITTGFSSC